MKTSIFLIGMVSLGFLNVNHAATANQTSFNQQSEQEHFLELVSFNQAPENVVYISETDYILNPSTIIPVESKTMQDIIREDNLIVDNHLTLTVSLDASVVKTTALSIYEDVQITEATNLNTVQPLDFEAINNNPNCFVDFQNKCSLKQENIKL